MVWVRVGFSRGLGTTQNRERLWNNNLDLYKLGYVGYLLFFNIISDFFFFLIEISRYQDRFHFIISFSTYLFSLLKFCFDLVISKIRDIVLRMYVHTYSKVFWAMQTQTLMPSGFYNILFCFPTILNKNLFETIDTKE